jgi:hypothetical protein
MRFSWLSVLREHAAIPGEVIKPRKYALYMFEFLR